MRTPSVERGGVRGRGGVHRCRILVHGVHLICESPGDTFSGIRPADVLGFIVAQLAVGIAATLVFRWLVPWLRSAAKDVTLAHDPASDNE